MSIIGPNIQTVSSCHRCGSDLEMAADTAGCCADETCPYFDHPQWMDYAVMTAHSRAEVDAMITQREGHDPMRAYRRRADQ